MVDGRKTNIIDSKWVLKKKTIQDRLIKYKTRLIIMGFKDRNAYDLKETYFPVSKLLVVISVLAIINKRNLETCQFDVKTAFFNVILDKEVYMEKTPEGCKCDKKTKNSKIPQAFV